jgi:hypothetical protein
MPDRLGDEIVAAIDRGLEIRLRRPDAVHLAGDVEVVIEQPIAPGRRLHWRQIVSRVELLTLAGDHALAYTIAQGSAAIEEAPQP